MRRPTRLAAAVLTGMTLTLTPPIHAEATPAPNHEEWWFDSMAIEQAWHYTKGKGVTIAVLDTGVNARLPEFRGDVLLPGIDFDQGKPEGHTDIDTQSGHGTGMMSLIAGQGGGRSGMVGVAPEAKILPITVHIHSDNGSKAIRYAVDHHANIISISQGSGGADNFYANHCRTDIQDAVTYALHHDVIVVAAAGNSGDLTNLPEYPGTCPGVIAVGAYDHNGTPWVSTQHQPYVALAAPGHQVSSLGKDGRLYHYGSGTSQATAITAGALALFRARFPHDSAQRIIQRATATATDLGPPGKDDRMGYGAISLRHGLTTNVPTNAPNPVIDRFNTALAANKRAAATADAEPTPQPAHSRAASPLVTLGLGGLVVLALAAIAIVVISRDRRRRPPKPEPYPAGDGPHPPQSPPPPF